MKTNDLNNYLIKIANLRPVKFKRIKTTIWENVINTIILYNDLISNKIESNDSIIYYLSEYIIYSDEIFKYCKYFYKNNYTEVFNELIDYLLCILNDLKKRAIELENYETAQNIYNFEYGVKKINLELNV